jgi:hypothetical protein
MMSFGHFTCGDGVWRPTLTRPSPFRREMTRCAMEIWALFDRLVGV